MNRIMLLGLLVCISRVALCGVMGVMAETVARRAGSSSLRGLCRLCVVAYALVLVASFASDGLGPDRRPSGRPAAFPRPESFHLDLDAALRRVHARHAPEERCRRLRRFDKL